MIKVKDKNGKVHEVTNKNFNEVRNLMMKATAK